MVADAAAGRRILVVEDEIVVAMLIEEVLMMAGYLIVGPVAKLETALQLARSEPLDGAVLDITIRGGQVFPVADVLRERGIPFLLSSGYGDWALPEAFRGQTRLQKPFTSTELETAVEALCPLP